MMWIALAALLVGAVVMALIHRLMHKPTKLHSVYTQPGPWWVYWPRWCQCLLDVWLEKRQRPKRLNNYDISEGYDWCGLEATPTEKEMEQTKALVTDRHEDSMLVTGVDASGRSVIARVVRLTKRRAQLVVSLKDNQGNIYCLPNQPDTHVYNTCGEEWHAHAGGLIMECVDPMRCWRIKFNGLLRRGHRQEYITSEESDDDDDQVVWGRMDLIWRAMYNPVELFADASTKLLAHALATESDADISWFSSMERDGYDQWGTLHGTVNIGEGQGPEVWYLRGARQHRWGLSSSASNFHRSVDIYTCLENGEVSWMQALSHTSSISNCIWGYVQEANGNCKAITSTDFSLPDCAEDGNIPKNLILKFKAGGDTHENWHQLGTGVDYYTGDPWTLRHSLHFTNVTDPKYAGKGLAVFSNRFGGLCPVPERYSLPTLQEPAVPDDAPLVMTLSCPMTASSALTGGKASSLAHLIHLQNDSPHEFVVPGGIVITAAAWQHQLEYSPELCAVIKGVEKVVAGGIASHLNNPCKRAEELIKNVAISPKITASLTSTLNELYPQGFENIHFAVRSSAVGEDGSEISCAGQNATVLGCCGLDSIYKALSVCWASYFTFHSVEYRRQRGAAVQNGMALVIQEMVSAEVAGVLFTSDPVTGNPSIITITANYGLGESVVSALAEPDTITLNKSWRNKLTIISKVCGSKKTKMVMSESGGTSEVAVEDKDTERICLNDSVALRLADISLYIQDAFGSPRDIEFAVKKNCVYLLQARPITNNNAWTDFELIHEQDTAVITDHELLTKANTGEVFPGGISPLTISILPSALSINMESYFMSKQLKKFNLHMPTHNLGVSHQHIFLNMLNILYRMNEPKLTAVHQAVDLNVFGHKVTTEQFLLWGIQRNGYMNIFQKVYVVLSGFYDLLLTRSRVNKAKKYFSKYNIRYEKADDAATVFNAIQAALPDIYESMTTHINTSAVSSLIQCIALVTMAEENKEISNDNVCDMASLLGSFGGVESADVPSALKAMAFAISINEEASEFLGMSGEEGRVWLGSHPGSLGNRFRAFLNAHGHRCIKEFDFESKSWSMDSRFLVENLQLMMRHPSSFKTSGKQVNLQESLKDMKSAVKNSTRRALGFILPRCHNAVVLRETTKSLLIKNIEALRLSYRNLGHMMVTEGRLPDAELIFYFKHWEIGQLLETRSSTLITKAMRRKRLQNHIEKLKFPEISLGCPKPMKICVEDNQSEGNVISGTPVCLGIVTGTARVVTDLKNAQTIQNGEILVTYSTDVGWTPYFPLLGGVITEIGGLISHGAVVAREYGLPCIVGAALATQIIHTGEVLVLNSSTGTITILKDKSNKTVPNCEEQNSKNHQESSSVSEESKVYINNTLICEEPIPFIDE